MCSFCIDETEHMCYIESIKKGEVLFGVGAPFKQNFSPAHKYSKKLYGLYITYILTNCQAIFLYIPKRFCYISIKIIQYSLVIMIAL